MANLEKFQTYPVICEGGWNSNQNHILLSQRTPGAATTLINYETSLFGGYRRLEGFEGLNSDAQYHEVDSAGAEGKIYGVAFYDGDIIAARKQQAGATYKFYKFVNASPWDDYATGLTLTSTDVSRIRNQTYNFESTEKIAFVDGVNNMAIFDGTTWVHANSTETGADHANAGGDQILDAPSLITLFQNHVFISGDADTPDIVAHSAPNADYDWMNASGAGQLPIGFVVVQIKPFRDALYVFGETQIKKIIVDSTTFVLKDVTNNIGCLAADSVQEINGDLVFLSQDGFRTIAATERNEDIELGNLSKLIQQDVTDEILSADLPAICSVMIRRKSQIRFFFSDELLATEANGGFIGCIKGENSVEHQNVGWEWMKLLGIKASCADSKYIGNEEYVIHGDYDGKVFRQESGSSFDGENIRAVYTMPYLDFDDVFIRKSLHKITVFLRPENGTVLLSTALQFNWGLPDVFNPDSYSLENSVSGVVYGEGVYGVSEYASAPTPVVISNVEGSGESMRVSFSSYDMSEPYSIQAVIFEYAINGRK
jgi:hypothetical protein